MPQLFLEQETQKDLSWQVMWPVYPLPLLANRHTFGEMLDRVFPENVIKRFTVNEFYDYDFKAKVTRTVTRCLLGYLRASGMNLKSDEA